MMSDNDCPTRFDLELPDFDLSISGDRAFVEELYRQVSQDLLPVLLARGPQTARAAAETEKMTPVTRPPSYTWVYGCTAYYNKVYVVDDAQLASGLLGPHVDPSQLRRIYVDRDEHDLFSALCGGQITLWAEFTEEGRGRFQS